MVVFGSEWPRNCWMTRRGASFMAMLVPTVGRMEWGEIAFVMPAARTYFFTIFWTERVVRGLSLPTLEVNRGFRESRCEVKLRCVSSTKRCTRRQRSGEIGTLRTLL